jgi:ribonuclease T2
MRKLNRRLFSAALLAGLLWSGIAVAESHKKKPSKFSYYMLVLSYAPNFCNQPQGDKDPRECGVGRHVGFIVHGLWPQGETSRGPENCAASKTVPRTVIEATLNYVPTESLIRHEWTAHGTCSGLSADDYFAALRKARDSVTLPADLDQPSQELQLRPAQIEAKVAAANPSFPASAFRTSCYRDGELQEVRICLNKDLSPRACGSSAGECTVASVTLLPVR